MSMIINPVSPRSPFPAEPPPGGHPAAYAGVGNITHAGMKTTVPAGGSRKISAPTATMHCMGAQMPDTAHRMAIDSVTPGKSLQRRFCGF